jgi:hypothetical protein
MSSHIKELRLLHARFRLIFHLFYDEFVEVGLSSFIMEALFGYKCQGNFFVLFLHYRRYPRYRWRPPQIDFRGLKGAEKQIGTDTILFDK